MKKGTIAFVSTHPSAGVGELWDNLATVLQGRGNSTARICLYEADGQADRPGWLRLSDQDLGSVRGMVKGLFGLWRWLRENRPAFVFTAMPAANVIVPAIASLASPATRVAISHHSPTTTYSPLLNNVDGVTGSFANVVAVVSVSDAVASSLSRKSGAYRAKTRTIRNALPPEIEAWVDSTFPAGERLAPRARKVVTNGRLAYQKNYPTLLSAIARKDDVTLDIIGSGPDERALREMAKTLGVEDRVRFLGQHGRRDALVLIGDGDIFAQVSRFEGHSLALIEAARLGLPLVVSDVPAQIEAVTASDGEVCATIVGVDDDAALADAIVGLLADTDAYRAASRRARRLALERSFDDVADAYEALAQRVGLGG